MKGLSPFIVGERVTILETSAAVRMFLQSAQAKGLSHDTIRWYAGILHAFAHQYPQLPDSPDDIENFLASCRAGDERRHGYYRTLRCFYRFLKRRLKLENPVEIVDPPRKRPKQPHFLMLEDLGQLLGFPHPPKTKTALLFFIDTGTRLGELANLDNNNLVETPWGYAARVNGKTGMRTVPINYETYHALMVNLPLGYTKHRLGRKIAEAFKKAKVKGSALTLRHTFATLWDGDESVLQKIMGHANFSTTLIYRHLRLKKIAEEHHRYSPLNMVFSQTKSML